MKQYFCDRCGKELDQVKHNQIRVLDFGNSTDFVTRDLCQSCTRGLWNYLNKSRINYNDIYREDF